MKPRWFPRLMKKFELDLLEEELDQPEKPRITYNQALIKKEIDDQLKCLIMNEDSRIFMREFLTGYVIGLLHRSANQ